MSVVKKCRLFLVFVTVVTVPSFVFSGCGNGGGATPQDGAVGGEFAGDVFDPGTIAGDVKPQENGPDVTADETVDTDSVVDGTVDLADNDTEIIADSGHSKVVYHCQGFLSCLEDCGSSISECASSCSESLEEPTKTKTDEFFACLSDNECLDAHGKADKDCIREQCLKQYDACLHPGKAKPCLEFQTYFSLCPDKSMDETKYYECVEKEWYSEGADEARTFGVCLTNECKGCNEVNLDPVTQIKCAYCETDAACGGPCQDAWAACASFGVHSCISIFDCLGSCGFAPASVLDEWCFNACLSLGSFQSQCKFKMLWNCLQYEACPESEDLFQCASEAIQGTCADRYQECLKW